MTSITDIKFSHIRNLLLQNGIDVPDDEKEAYDIAYTLMNAKGTSYDNVSISIIEWMLAHNLLKLNKKIRKYDIQELQELSEEERLRLGLSLGMKTGNIDIIISILKFSDNLIENYSLSKVLPRDPILYIINFMTIEQTMAFCFTDKNIYNACDKRGIKNIITSKLDTKMDISDFSLKELFIYSKVLNLYGKIGLHENKDSLLLNGKIYVLHLNGDYIIYELSSDLDICDYTFYNFYARDIVFIDKKHNFYHHKLNDQNKNKVYKIERNNLNKLDIVLPKAIKVLPKKILDDPEGFYILTSDGKYYDYEDGNLDLINDHEGMVQYTENYMLNYLGEVFYYDGAKINHLEKIKQITENGYALSDTGEIYNIEIVISNNEPVSIITNIVKIATAGNNSLLLDNKGKVYYTNFPLEDEIKWKPILEDIMEISLNGYNLTALSKRDELIRINFDDGIKVFKIAFV